ncbi:MAG: TolC family protein [Candidatus Latescibacterota bacterium]|nr:TolC family protein [Candidatus Latescibacterota bacterium]
MYLGYLRRISCGLWAFFLALTGARAETTLSLSHCLDAAMGHNRELIQARETIRQVEGSRIVVRSRFMPHLDLTATYDARRTSLSDGKTDDQLGSALRFSQRLFEFGPDFAAEVETRDALRQAVYAYEDQVYQVLSRVWELFHLILLQDRQIAIRRESRDNFQAAYERQQARFDRQLATESDVLNAQLSVLDEELAINNLERAQFNNKMDLLRLIGQPIGTDIRLTGGEVEFAIDQDRAVEWALENSVAVALASERLKEQGRKVREIAWEYSPDINFDAGVQDGQRNARVELGKEGQTWGMDVSSELALRATQPPEFVNETRWSALVEARIPIFEGASRIGRETSAKARLRQLEIGLRDLHAETELNVRQAYQQVLEAEGSQRIQTERVKIARRRLEINQILKDKGQVDENLLETFRNQFFDTQARLFQNQENFIRRIAQLRRQMGYFE